jgi:two-component sensor histidine kinase
MKNLLSIIFFLVFTVCNGQSKDSNYTVKWVDAHEGLNQLSVRSCIQDNDGFIWIATELGLFRYDGSKVNAIYDTKNPDINNKRISYIAKDAVTGNIYFLTYPQLKTYSICNGKIKEVRNIKKEGFFQSQHSFFNTKRSNYTNIYKSLIKGKTLNDQANLFLFLNSLATKNYFYYNDSNCTICIDSKGNKTKIRQTNTIGYLFFQFGNTVIGIDNNKIDLIENNQIKQRNISCDKIITSYKLRIELSYPYKRIFSSNGRCFLHFKGSIYEIKYNGKKLYTQFLFKSPADDIRDLLYSKKEDLFYLCSATKGLAIVKQKKINVFTTGNDILDCNYSIIEINGNWFSNTGWQYNRFTNQFKINKFSSFVKNPSFILSYKTNNYIKLGNKKFLSIEDGETYAPLKINTKFDNLTSYTYFKNKLWISSITNVGYFFNNTAVIDKTIERNIPSDREIKKIFTLKDELIICTTKGVYKYNPQTKVIGLIPGLKNVYARYIKQIDNNCFWVGCYGDGLFIVKNNKAHKVVDKNIELTTAHAIEEDESGNLWISTNNGLLTIDKKTIINNTLNKLPIACYRFSVEDGLLTNEFNGGSTHPSLKTKDEIIGFPSMKGFVWFNSKKLKKYRFSGNIKIDNIIIDNKEIAQLKDSNYTIHQNVKILKINFSYAFYYNRENLTIAYRFEDQANWTTVKGNSFQIGRYKKGINKLQIRINTHGFNENQGVVKSINLDFEPSYNETLWFWLVISILMISLIYISYLIGLNIKKKIEIQLKNKIDEKTKELKLSIIELEMSKESLDKSLQVKNVLLKEIHHRVKNNLQLVMSLLNIQSRKNNNKEINEFIQKSQARINSIALIHQNLYNTENISKVEFNDYLNQLLNSIKLAQNDKTDKVKFILTKSDLYFEIHTAIPLGLILNELITNSLKHAFPNEVDFGQIKISIIEEQNNNYFLFYEDNGVGYNNSEIQSSSIGIQLINILVQQINGNISHTNENGTKYKISFKEV